MRTKRSLLPALEVGIVVVACLATLIADNGWAFWLPTAAVLAIAWCVQAKLGR
jgi:hypothetical protein